MNIFHRPESMKKLIIASYLFNLPVCTFIYTLFFIHIYLSPSHLNQSRLCLGLVLFLVNSSLFTQLSFFTVVWKWLRIFPTMGNQSAVFFSHLLQLSHLVAWHSSWLFCQTICHLFHTALFAIPFWAYFWPSAKSTVRGRFLSHYLIRQRKS